MKEVESCCVFSRKMAYRLQLQALWPSDKLQGARIHRQHGEVDVASGGRL
jgi:hypothetical protein